MFENTLRSFAVETRHKHADLNINNAEEQVFKKMLATQSPKNTNWRNVYNHVSNDIERIEFRTPNVLNEYADNRTFPLDFFIKAFVDQELATTSKYYVLDDFIKTVLPPVGFEYALFFSKNSHKHKDFIPTLNSICDGDTNRADKLYDSLLSYNPESNNTATQIGEMIVNFNFSKLIGNIILDPNRIVACDSILEKKDKLIEKKANTFELLAEKSWTNDVERLYRHNIHIFKFKQENDLPTQYPSLEVASQLLIDGNCDILDVIDYYPNNTITKLVQTSQSKNFYQKNFFKPNTTKRDFLKKLLKTEAPGNEFVKLIKVLIQ